MTFDEILPALRSNGVIRRASWPEGRTLRLGRPALDGPPILEIRRPGLLFGIVWHPTSPDLLGDDWLVVP